MTQPAHDPDGIYLAAAKALYSANFTSTLIAVNGWPQAVAMDGRLRAAVDAAVAYARAQRVLDTATPTLTQQPGATSPIKTDHPEARCRRCGIPNINWYAPSPLWNQVIRGGDINGEETFAGIVCPTCFAVLAEQQGVADEWRLCPQRVLVELQMVTPSGRMWDPQAWLWRSPESPTTQDGGL